MKPKPSGILHLHRSTLESQRVGREFERQRTLKHLAEDRVIKEIYKAARQERETPILHKIQEEEDINNLSLAIQQESNRKTMLQVEIQSKILGARQLEAARINALREEKMKQLLWDNSPSLHEMATKISCMRIAEENKAIVAQREIQKNQEKAARQKVAEEYNEMLRRVQEEEQAEREHALFYQLQYKRELDEQTLYQEQQRQLQQKVKEKELTQLQETMQQIGDDQKSSLQTRIEKQKQLRQEIDDFLARRAAHQRRQLESLSFERRRMETYIQRRQRQEQIHLQNEMERLKRRECIKSQAMEKYLDEDQQHRMRLSVGMSPKGDMTPFQDKENVTAAKCQQLRDDYLHQIHLRQDQLLKEIAQEEKLQQIAMMKMVQEQGKHAEETKLIKDRQKEIRNVLQQQIQEQNKRILEEKAREFQDYIEQMKRECNQQSLEKEYKRKMLLNYAQERSSLPRLSDRETLNQNDVGTVRATWVSSNVMHIM